MSAGLLDLRDLRRHAAAAARAAADHLAGLGVMPPRRDGDESLAVSWGRAVLAGIPSWPPAIPMRLAVAFTDLEGWSAFTLAEGDLRAQQMLARHYRLASELVRGYGGRVVKRLGDGLFLTFSAPADAVRACLGLVDNAPAPLRVRAGAHHGSVVVTAADVVGHVVNVAARLAESAEGGEVLVSSEVREAVEPELAAVSFGISRQVSLNGHEGSPVFDACPVRAA